MFKSKPSGFQKHTKSRLLCGMMSTFNAMENQYDELEVHVVFTHFHWIALGEATGYFVASITDSVLI